MSKPLISVGGLIKSINTNRYLFLMRGRESSYPSKWSLCGGKVEKDEYITSALTRELTEELGTLPPIVKMINFNWFKSMDKNFEYHSFLILIDDEFIPILNKENSGYAWVDIENPPKPLHPRLKDVLSSGVLVASLKNFK